MTPTEKILINEIEQLILHAEEDTLHYDVLEHARKLVYTLTVDKDQREAEKLGEMNHIKERDTER